MAERLEGRRGSVSARQGKDGSVIVDDPDHPEGEQGRQTGRHTNRPDHGHDHVRSAARPTRLERSNNGVVTVHRNNGQRQNTHVQVVLRQELLCSQMDLLPCI